jgi:hypothetical protein
MAETLAGMEPLIRLSYKYRALHMQPRQHSGGHSSMRTRGRHTNNTANKSHCTAQGSSCSTARCATDERVARQQPHNGLHQLGRPGHVRW